MHTYNQHTYTPGFFAGSGQDLRQWQRLTLSLRQRPTKCLCLWLSLTSFASRPTIVLKTSSSNTAWALVMMSANACTWCAWCLWTHGHHVCKFVFVIHLDAWTSWHAVCELHVRDVCKCICVVPVKNCVWSVNTWAWCLWIHVCDGHVACEHMWTHVRLTWRL